mgnify:CR=1 FL=1
MKQVKVSFTLDKTIGPWTLVIDVSDQADQEEIKRVLQDYVTVMVGEGPLKGAKVVDIFLIVDVILRENLSETGLI